MGGYTGIVGGEAGPASVFGSLISEFSQRFGQQADAEICEKTTRNLRTAFGRFAYDPPMKYGSGQSVLERTPNRPQRTLRMWISLEVMIFAEAARWKRRHESGVCKAPGAEHQGLRICRDRRR